LQGCFVVRGKGKTKLIKASDYFHDSESKTAGRLKVAEDMWRDMTSSIQVPVPGM